MRRRELISIFIFLFAPIVFAAPTDFADQVSSVRQDLLESEAEKRRVLGSLYEVNRKMKVISKEKSALNDELYQVQSQAEALAQTVQELEQQISAQKERLHKRLRAMYKLSGQNYVAILFSRQTPQQLDQTLKFLKLISDADHKLIRAYQANMTLRAQEKEKLSKQVRRLLALEKRIQKQEDRLSGQHEEKTKIIARLERAQNRALKRLQDLREKSQGMGFDDNLIQLAFFEQKGRLPEPVRGQLAQDFGFIRNESGSIHLSHKGWHYRTEPGAGVSAVFSGNVSFSGWIDGFGNTVIVDHGDHYYTVYANLGRSKVAQGARVKQKDVIGDAGNTPRFGTGVYFEIRHFSEPENPKNWLAQRSIDLR